MPRVESVPSNWPLSSFASFCACARAQAAQAAQSHSHGQPCQAIKPPAINSQPASQPARELLLEQVLVARKASGRARRDWLAAQRGGLHVAPRGVPTHHVLRRAQMVDLTREACHLHLGALLRLGHALLQSRMVGCRMVGW